MFKKSIESTPFTSDVADSLFHNINGERYGNDNTFLATLRALIAPRIKEEESIMLRFTSSQYSSNVVESNTAVAVVRAIWDRVRCTYDDDQLIIHSFDGTHDDNLANLKVIESNFTKEHSDYHRLEKVTEFYHKSFAVDCYINTEKRNVIVFVDRLDNKKLHYLQVSILAFFPWYFDPSKGVSEDEMALLYSLRESLPDKYESCVARLAEKYDFRTARIKKLLDGFETRFEKIECHSARNDILSFDHDIDALNARIGDLLKRRNERCIYLMGLERKIAEGSDDSEIMDYFLCNNKMHLEDVTDWSMDFSVKDYLTYFDPDMAEMAINNMRSYVYPGEEESCNGISAADMKMLMSEIFLSEKPRLRIKFCAAYHFDLNGSVSALGDYSFSDDFASCMPNPHINRFSCIGNYRLTINNLLKNRDYIGALEQCAASCKSLNFGDSPVMREFMSSLYGTNCVNDRCIELPDGTVVDSRAAIRWLKEQSNEATAETGEES